MTEQTEHRHIPIPEIVQGRAPDNIGIRPNSSRCIECGELVPDHPDTARRWQAFLYREMQVKEIKDERQ